MKIIQDSEPEQRLEMDFKEFRRIQIKSRQDFYDYNDSITERKHHSGPRLTNVQYGRPISGIGCCCRRCQRLRKIKRNFRDIFSIFIDYREYNYIRWEASRQTFYSDEECRDFYVSRLPKIPRNHRGY